MNYVILNTGEAESDPAISGCFVKNPFDLVSHNIKFKRHRWCYSRARARKRNLSLSSSLFFIEVREQSLR
jgi:hypothetical protein